MLPPALIAHVVRQMALPIDGIHGLAHWARVRANGLRLAAETGARADVVELFALLHDSRRINEGYDPEHGHRGAQLAGKLRGQLFDLDDEGFDLLTVACHDHSFGFVEGELAVRICWDADRLDLPRVGIRVDRRLLCTDAARSEAFFDEAVNAALAGSVPPEVAAWEQFAARPA